VTIQWSPMWASAIASSPQPSRGKFVVSPTMCAGWSAATIAAHADRWERALMIGAYKHKPAQADTQRPA
jgi:hypothetical protein